MIDVKYIIPDWKRPVKKEVELWVVNGHGYQEENDAIKAAATDRICAECDELVGNTYNSYCHSCIDKHKLERYISLPEKEWDGESPLYWNENYYNDIEDIEQEYRVQNEIDDDAIIDLSTLVIYLSQERKPVFDISLFMENFFCDDESPYRLEGTEELEINIQSLIDKWLIENNHKVYYPDHKYRFKL